MTVCGYQTEVMNSNSVGVWREKILKVANMGSHRYHHSVEPIGSHALTPAFKGRHQRLSHQEVENSRKISNVHIHVERSTTQNIYNFTK